MEGGVELARNWSLDPEVVFLNHGSFGACPKIVLEHQAELRARLEREPVQFFVRDVPGMLDAAREELGAFVGARAESLAFVRNATQGVNAVLRSMRLEAGDELIVTDQEYNASRNALEFVAERAGARVVVVPVPFPMPSQDTVLDLLLERVNPRTRLLLIDHVTSQTGLVLPLARIVEAMRERGVECLVDGAHGPGMVPLALEELGVAYYTGNCHKWICAPKGAGLLFVREDLRDTVRPTSISHGANTRRPGRSRFHDEFDWTGTDDPTPALCVPAALRAMEAMLPGGWDEVRERNRALALAARGILCESLGIEEPAPRSMVGSLAAVPLPDGDPEAGPHSALYDDALQDVLRGEYAVQVPIVPWPAPPKRLVRVSAQLYNREDHYRTLARALAEQLSPATS